MTTTRERSGRSSASPPSLRAAAWGVLGLELAGVVLLGLAMRRYPGGTWCDPATEGHVFFANYFCDLTSSVSVGGGDNASGASFARAGMLALTGAILVFFAMVPALFGASARGPRRSVARAVRGLGAASAVAAVGVALMPSTRFGSLHAASVFASALSGLAAAGLALWALASSGRERALARLGVLALVLVALDLAMYGWHVAHPGACASLVPGLQKVAAGLLLAWLAAGASRVLARAQV